MLSSSPPAAVPEAEPGRRRMMMDMTARAGVRPVPNLASHADMTAFWRSWSERVANMQSLQSLEEVPGAPWRTKDVEKNLRTLIASKISKYKTIVRAVEQHVEKLKREDELAVANDTRQLATELERTRFARALKAVDDRIPASENKRSGKRNWEALVTALRLPKKAKADTAPT